MPKDNTNGEILWKFEKSFKNSTDLFTTELQLLTLQAIQANSAGGTRQLSVQLELIGTNLFHYHATLYIISVFILQRWYFVIRTKLC